MSLDIIIDTREQLPLDFSAYPEVRTSRAEIWPGDYSLKGHINDVAVERKSVSDLIGTMCTAYAGWDATTPKRFDRALKALRGYPTALLLVEPDGLAAQIGNTAEEQIKAHQYRSKIPPNRVLAFVERIRSTWRVPVVYARSRRHAAEIVVDTLSAVALSAVNE